MNRTEVMDNLVAHKSRMGIVMVLIITAVVLFVGAFNLPIGYYRFLRIEVFVASIVWLVYNWKDGLRARNIITALFGILMNPIFPIYLHSKTAWQIIDVAVGLWFVAMAIVELIIRKSEGEEAEE